MPLHKVRIYPYIPNGTDSFLKMERKYLFKQRNPQFLIAITLALCLFRKQLYNTEETLSFNQYIGVSLVLFHYVKRELETLFIHRFGNETMPWVNIVKNCFGYWFIFGICCM